MPSSAARSGGAHRVASGMRRRTSFFFKLSVEVTAEVSAAAAIDPAPAAAARSSKAIAGRCRCGVRIVPRIVPRCRVRAITVDVIFPPGGRRTVHFW